MTSGIDTGIVNEQECPFCHKPNMHDLNEVCPALNNPKGFILVEVRHERYKRLCPLSGTDSDRSNSKAATYKPIHGGRSPIR